MPPTQSNPESQTDPNTNDDEVQIPQSCDVKEALILKLEEFDNQLHHLIESNKYFEKELEEAKVNGVDEEEYANFDEMQKEYGEYISENADIILNKKNQVIKILNAFIKAGSNLDRDVFPKLKYKHEYIPGFCSEMDMKKKEDHYVLTTDEAMLQPQQASAQQMENLHQATTFDDVIRVEAGGQGAQAVDDDDDQIDSSAVNKKYKEEEDPNFNGGDPEEDDDEQMPASISDMIKKTE